MANDFWFPTAKFPLKSPQIGSYPTFLKRADFDPLQLFSDIWLRHFLVGCLLFALHDDFNSSFTSGISIGFFLSSIAGLAAVCGFLTRNGVCVFTVVSQFGLLMRPHIVQWYFSFSPRNKRPQLEHGMATSEHFFLWISNELRENWPLKMIRHAY